MSSRAIDGVAICGVTLAAACGQTVDGGGARDEGNPQDEGELEEDGLDAATPTGSPEAVTSQTAPETRIPPLLLDPAERDTEDLPLQLTFDPAVCYPMDLELDLDIIEEYATTGGILVKVLQRPDFTEQTRIDYENPDAWRADPVEPADWDRSEFPAGACVVRLRGVIADCYDNGNSWAMHVSSSDDGRLSPVGQSHYNRDSINSSGCDLPDPGCPVPQWGGTDGYWWYLRQRESDTLLVSCAPQCAQFFVEPTQIWLRGKGIDPACPG